MENKNKKVRVDEDLLLKHFWGEETIRGILDYDKNDSFKCKVYTICFRILQTKLSEINKESSKKSWKKKFDDFYNYYQYIGSLSFNNRILLDGLKEGKIYYEDDGITPIKLMESVITNEEIENS